MKKIFNNFTKMTFVLLLLTSCAQKETVQKIELPALNENEAAVYFVQVQDKKPKLKAVYRELSSEPLKDNNKEVNESKKKLFLAISNLVKGPNESEQSESIGSEIPKGTRLISFQNEKDKVTVNLTDQFRAGGGSRTMIMRYKQLYYTVAANAGEKPVYVLIESKPFKRLGGEGLLTDDPIYEIAEK